jgi:hypothetical protein
LLAPRLARAQPPSPASDPLAAARATFAEALADEKAGRFDSALEKFERVAQVKVTAPVEYRVGTCYEGLHAPVRAYEAYRKAVSLGEGDDAMADVVAAARDRLDTLSKYVARLTLVLPPDAPQNAEVRVDGISVGGATASEPLPLEPGKHEVVATASGATPFRTQVVLPEGGEATVQIALVPVAKPPPPEQPPAPVENGSRGTFGWIGLSAGGILLGAGGVVLLLRHDDIASLQSACPRGVCPAGSDVHQIQSTHDRAAAEGPIAAALAGGGVAAAVVGLYLLLTDSSNRATSSGRVWLAPVVRSDGTGAQILGAF